MVYKLQKKIKVVQEKAFPVIYAKIKFNCSYIVGIIVNIKVIIELKVIEDFKIKQKTQCFKYIQL